MKLSIKRRTSLLLADAEVQPCSEKLLSWLTCLWTSQLRLVTAANISRCLFWVPFQSLIYACEDSAILHVILQEREESITNGIHVKPALLFPFSVPPRFSDNILISSEHRLQAHTVRLNSFNSITVGLARLSPLYLQLGWLTPLNSKSREAFGKIYEMTSRLKTSLSASSSPLYNAKVLQFEKEHPSLSSSAIGYFDCSTAVNQSCAVE